MLTDVLTDLQNPHQLSPTALASLAAVLQAAEALAADLPAPLLRYLVDGVGEDTIATDLLWGIQQYCTQHHPHLLTDPNMGRRLGLIALPAAFALDHTASDRPLLAWISAYPVADPAFYTRLVRLVSCFYETQVDASGQIQLGILSDRFNRLLQGALPTYYFTQGEAPPPAAQCLSTAIVAGVYCAEGHPAAAFARDVYDVGPHDYWRQALAKHAVYLTGFADYSLQHAAIVQAVLHHEERDRRLHALTLLAQGQVPITPWLGAIVQAAVASAKSEREAALPLIKQNLAIALPDLQAKATSGSASDRLYAAKLLWELQGEAAQPFLTDRLAVEKNAKTKATLEALLATATAAPPPPLALPPLPPVDPTPPLPSDLTATLERLADLLYQGRLHWGYWLFEALKHNHQAGKSLDDQFRCFGLALADKAAIIDLITATLATPPLDATEAVKQVIALLDARSQTPEIAAHYLCAQLQQGTYAECARDVRWGAQMYANQIKKEAKTLLTRPDFHLIHAVRLLALLGYMPVQSIQYQAALVFSPEGHELLAVYRQHHPDGGGLREFAAVLEALGVNPDLIATEMLNYWGTSGFWRWGTDAIWPYYAERSPLLEQILTQPTQEYGDQWRRKHAFRAIQTWPQPPAPLIPLLWKLALEGSKAERGIAQGCLNALPETPERILATLSHPDRELRTIAASWLGDRGDPAAIPPLQQALKTEKSDAAKDIMLRSLEKLGATVDDLLNRDRLLQECQTLLKKGFPAALDWFPWAALPTVHWQDTGAAVDPAIVQGLIVQCFKQKTPEPGPILKRYVALWSPAEREAVGQVVLDSWLTQDTLPAYTPAEADTMAQKQAQGGVQYHQQAVQQYPNFYGPGYTPPTYEELYRAVYNDLIKTCKGSAVKEKGILAIAAACCGPRAVPPISRYLKTWYGNRMAQCKALLQVLAWTNDPSAIQLLLAVANRFRTKGIQKEAEMLVTALAERHGWSRDELGDRTLPTAGFDDGATQTLDYGSRQFTLLLDTDLSLVLKNADGKVIKALPTPNQTDDPEQVKAAKQQLADTKKQVKQALSQQRERLYEAMCTQRSWRFQDWDTYLNRHPIVGRYCQQLVWAIYPPGSDGETLEATVRPLEDRTLTNATDEEVTPDPAAIVRIAHTCTVPAEAIAAWQTHLADYEVTPLFAQFHPSAYRLPATQHQDTELSDFEGYVLEAFKLRGGLLQRGYGRGETEDAGWFYDYHKSFAGLGIEAVIGFSGNYLPEENRPVALTTLSFHRLPEADMAESWYQRAALPLGELPPVLLSEVWSELHAIATQGSYDPDWEKKVGI